MSGNERTERYDPSSYPPVAVTVDVVLLTIIEDSLAALLVRRGAEPFKGTYALPGGFVQPDETLATAAAGSSRRKPAPRACTWSSSAPTAIPVVIRGCGW